MVEWFYGYVMRAFESLGERVLDGLRFFLAWLVDMSLPIFAWLPDHIPLLLPDPQHVNDVLAAFGIFARWVHWPIVLPLFGAIITLRVAGTLYGILRLVYGLIPMFK